jgi:NADH-quinone oxidoreductase subunit L
MENNIITITSYLAFFLPLMSFLFAWLFKKKLPKKFLLISSITMVLIAALAFDLGFYYLLQEEISYNFLLLPWLDIPYYLKAHLVIKLDRLSGIMGIIVLNISALVHVYSLGYMSYDPEEEKFMGYLSLFTFFMLILIFADNSIV